VANLMIYGAYGYTGALIARRARAAGLDPVLSGRNPAKLAALGRELGCRTVVLDLQDTAALRAALSEVDAVLNCAGPFHETWEPMTAACLDTGTHYLDITGEPPALEGCAALDDRAKAAGITILPAVGFDVVPTDCLAGLLARRLPDATRLTLAFAGTAQFSRGTIRTSARHLADPVLVRENGRIVPRSGPDTVRLDFGNGPQEAHAMTWGDIFTAYRTTGIPNIEVFIALPKDMLGVVRAPQVVKRLLASPLGKPLLALRLRMMPPGPDETMRRTARVRLYGRAGNDAGETVELRMTTVEGYELTSRTALEIATRAADGQLPPGYQTPAAAMGPEYILGIDGTELTG